MGGERRNLELKARDPDPERSLRVCLEIEAEDRGTLRQRDTYFDVPRGRLKLREEPGRPTQLIAYERGNELGQSLSRYRIAEVGEGSSIGETLEASLEVVAVVEKTRRLFLFEGVRIHLDAVDGLGNFIEFEAVTAPSDADLIRFEELLTDLRRSFGIEAADLIGKSYCDLAMAGAEPSSAGSAGG